MIRRPPRSTQSRSSAASDVYKRQLLQSVRIDAEILDILVLDESLAVLTLLCVVEEALSVDTIFAVLKNQVTENVSRFLVLVLPHKRDLSAILVREGVGANRPAIGALDPVLGDVPGEIRYHFDVFLGLVVVEH